MYLESFRLPGEAQKINRIMETFGMHYHRQCPDIFRNADAVYILAYSVIILNTDQHNDQVQSELRSIRRAAGAQLVMAMLADSCIFWYQQGCIGSTGAMHILPAYFNMHSLLHRAM